MNNNGNCAEEGNGPIHGVLGTPPASPPPSQDDHLEIEVEPNDPTTSTRAQYLDEKNIDWDPNSQSVTHLNDTLIEDANATNIAFGTTENSTFFDIDFGNLGFGFDDMIDIDNFL